MDGAIIRKKCGDKTIRYVWEKLEKYSPPGQEKLQVAGGAYEGEH